MVCARPSAALAAAWEAAGRHCRRPPPRPAQLYACGPATLPLSPPIHPSNSLARDVHFYLTNQSAIEAIKPGPCMNVAVDAFEDGNQPLPAACFPEGAGYANIGALAPLMGNHLVDMTAPEITVCGWVGGWGWGGAV